MLLGINLCPYAVPCVQCRRHKSWILWWILGNFLSATGASHASSTINLLGWQRWMRYWIELAEDHNRVVNKHPKHPTQAEMNRTLVRAVGKICPKNIPDEEKLQRRHFKKYFRHLATRCSNEAKSIFCRICRIEVRFWHSVTTRLWGFSRDIAIFRAIRGCVSKHLGGECLNFTASPSLKMSWSSKGTRSLKDF